MKDFRLTGRRVFASITSASVRYDAVELKSIGGCVCSSVCVCCITHLIDYLERGRISSILFYILLHRNDDDY